MAANSAYGAAEREVRELFGGYLCGEVNCAVLVVSSEVVSETVCDALEKSFASLGYGKSACLYAHLNGSASDEATLDEHALFLLIEGIDPTFLVCCDKNASRKVASAYRVTCVTDSYNRVFGRSAAMFTNLETLLENTTGKRKAWEIMKALPLVKVAR